jgi:hypothetical protein
LSARGGAGTPTGHRLGRRGPGPARPPDRDLRFVIVFSFIGWGGIIAAMFFTAGRIVLLVGAGLMLLLAIATNSGRRRRRELLRGRAHASKEPDI